ncbi:MAG: DUF1592 domain-containing protein [Acidobacteriia bacterium]|nr:DUF1592 domain-containing protein [Terriglobia bacterium]
MQACLRMALCAAASVALLVASEFESSIRPVLVEHCGACHSGGTDNRIRFLEARSADSVSAEPSLWRNVAMQLRNRTMPPTGPQPSEGDRMRVADWIDRALRAGACDLGVYAGPVTVRRLNRVEYQNTVRDLTGLPIDVAELFPVDGSGGEGFDNNGETLFLSPLLAERYLEVADLILDQVVITPDLTRSFVATDLLPGREADEHNSVAMAEGDSVSRTLSFYEDGEYAVRAVISSPEANQEPVMDILLDGRPAGKLRFAWSAAEATSSSRDIPATRGEHTVTLKVADQSPMLRLVTLDIAQKRDDPATAKRAAHLRLFGSEPGETVISPRAEAARLLRRFMTRGFRRPLNPDEEEPYLSLFDRSAERGDPFEVSIRLALKAVLVSPAFLYRIEEPAAQPGIKPLSGHELATRLSYFLWGTTPDSELMHLASAGRLQEDEVLAAQVDRLIDHPSSRFFARTFIGQWLGTKDVGGRVAPTLNEIQHFYTPRIAADMREEPVLLFQRMLAEDRSMLEFVSADYTYLTERLAQFYGMPDAVQGNKFQLVHVPGGERGGLLGLGAAQAMNAGYKRTSPVLRGVWVLETLLGTKIPTPPPDIPDLEDNAGEDHGQTMREVLNGHRADPSCAACHDLIDPIGFGLENYDWLGRWRDADEGGRPVDATGTLPSGESFDGPAGLRRVLLAKQDQLLRQIARKVLGYALGRSLLDRDECAIETILRELEDSNYGTRSLIRRIVLSVPFRFTQNAEADSLASRDTIEAQVR